MEKLVRDKIPEFSERAKDGRKFRTAAAFEMPHLLSWKLVEEAAELADELVRPVFDREATLKEVADLKQVLVSIEKELAFSPAEVERVQSKKYREKGGFEQRVVLDLDSNTGIYDPIDYPAP